MYILKLTSNKRRGYDPWQRCELLTTFRLSDVRKYIGCMGMPYQK